MGLKINLSICLGAGFLYLLWSTKESTNEMLYAIDRALIIGTIVVLESYNRYVEILIYLIDLSVMLWYKYNMNYTTYKKALALQVIILISMVITVYLGKKNQLDPLLQEIQEDIREEPSIEGEQIV